MRAFNKLHPITKGAFFICAFVLVLAASNPYMSIISLCAALAYLAVSGGRAFFSSLRFSFIVVILVGLFNMLFVHRGVTPLFSIKQVDFTLEALVYGLNQGAVMAVVLLWFRILSYVQDSAETAYLLRFAPKIALLFSMVLGFLPRFHTKLHNIRDAQRGLYGSEDKKFRDKYRTAIHNLSALVTYSLESSIVTADSMTARGYNHRAVAYSRYKLTTRDMICTALTLAAFVYVVYSKATGRTAFLFEPEIVLKSFDIMAVILFTILMLIPSAVEIWEVLLWKKSQSRI